MKKHIWLLLSLLLLSVCSTACATREVKVPVIEEVPVIVRQPVYPPATLLIPCDDDPVIATPTPVNEDAVRQSLARRASLDRCRAIVEAMIRWAATVSASAD